VVFAPETLVPLATQVAEIRAICGVLFDARIHALTGLRRAPIAKEDQEAADYLTGKKPTTNSATGVVLVPYEIQFQGFTAELAAVLEGFYRSTNCFIVRNIDVQTNISSFATTTAAPTPAFVFAPPAASPGAVPPASQLSEMLMQRRYGIGRYGRPPPVAAPVQPPPTTGATAPPPRKGPETILDERPFRVTMYLEAIRLAERAGPKSAK
jgi:hypothetical protein